MIRRPPRSTLPYPPFPYPALVRLVSSPSTKNRAAEIPVQATIHCSIRVGSICAVSTTIFRRASKRPGRVPTGREGSLRSGFVKMLAKSKRRSPIKPWGSIASQPRSEEHTSELQSLMRSSYAVFCLKKKTRTKTNTIRHDCDPSHQHSKASILQSHRAKTIKLTLNKLALHCHYEQKSARTIELTTKL